jgi:hypothetical protein
MAAKARRVKTERRAQCLTPAARKLCDDPLKTALGRARARSSLVFIKKELLKFRLIGMRG